MGDRVRIDDYPDLLAAVEDEDEFRLIELEFREFIESMGLADSVILDFSERMHGDSELVIALDTLKGVESGVNHSAHVYTVSGTIYGLWRVTDQTEMNTVLEERNEAYNKLVKALTDASLGLFHVNVTGGSRNTYAARTDDTRFFFGFELNIELKFAIR